MAHFWEPSVDDVADWEAWVKSRPVAVRAVAERFDPWSLYRIKSTGQRVTLYSFSEPDDGRSVTLTVEVTGKFNFHMFDCQVFGVNPDDLEPCELPEPLEMIGTVLTDDDEIEEYVDEIRPAVLAARDKH